MYPDILVVTQVGSLVHRHPRAGDPTRLADHFNHIRSPRIQSMIERRPLPQNVQRVWVGPSLKQHTAVVRIIKKTSIHQRRIALFRPCLQVRPTGDKQLEYIQADGVCSIVQRSLGGVRRLVDVRARVEQGFNRLNIAGLDGRDKRFFNTTRRVVFP